MGMSAPRIYQLFLNCCDLCRLISTGGASHAGFLRRRSGGPRNRLRSLLSDTKLQAILNEGLHPGISDRNILLATVCVGNLILFEAGLLKQFQRLVTNSAIRSLVIDCILLFRERQKPIFSFLLPSELTLLDLPVYFRLCLLMGIPADVAGKVVVSHSLNILHRLDVLKFSIAGLKGIHKQG